MKTSYDRVREFHLVFGHPVSEAPNTGTPELRALRVRLIAEELCELAAALGVSLIIDNTGNLKDLDDAVCMCEADNVTTDLVAAADALGDLDYVVNGAALGFGIPLPSVTAEVHRSNMSKLGEDGKPICREDGKVLKGPGYFKPNISAVLAENYKGVR